MGSFLYKFDKFGTPPCFLRLLVFNKPILVPVNVCKVAGWVANIVDPDQTPRSVTSDLDLHPVFAQVCLSEYIE